MHLAAHEKAEQHKWEHTRVIAYYVAKFGNSDPKKFPGSIKKFMPLPWDESDPAEFDIVEFARSRARKNKL